MPPAHSSADSGDDTSRSLSRRRLLQYGLGGLAVVLAGGAGALELVDHDVLPGKARLDQLDGACDVPSTAYSFEALGQSVSGTFLSQARGQEVGYTIALPPGHTFPVAYSSNPDQVQPPEGPKLDLPLIVMLHGYGENHATALAGISPAQALAMVIDGSPLPPMAMVTVDGGDGYWNPHPGDDPMGMVIDELIPMCQKTGLGSAPNPIASMGISMGGYGALLLAERHPQLISAVAAISPAIWTSYSEAEQANSGAYASAAAFADNDAVTLTGNLVGIPVRVASGIDDPFHSGVEALARVLPKGAVVDFSKGCHTGAFFTEQQPLSLAFLGLHIGS